jgi:hypothetical protein
MNRFSTSIIAGIAGAAALTAVHQLARHRVANAPRMDVLGKRAIARLTKRPLTEPASADLEWLSLTGDLLANSLYYALIGTPSRYGVWQTGAGLGFAAGAGALLLPERLGLGPPPHSDSAANKVMTVAWYLIGGLAAACTFQWLDRVGTAEG